MIAVSAYIMGALYIAAGLNHFRVPRFYDQMMPPYFPAHRAMVLLSGVAEVALGIGVMFEPTRAIAAWLIAAMLVLFFTVHVHMLQNRELFPKAPKWALIARIPMQFVLIAWALVHI